MIKDAVVVRLRPRDGAVLEARLRAPTTPQRDVLRARIVLLAALEPDEVRCLGGEVGVRALAPRLAPRELDAHAPQEMP